MILDDKSKVVDVEVGLLGNTLVHDSCMVLLWRAVGEEARARSNDLCELSQLHLS